jgi:hypothetical protein
VSQPSFLEPEALAVDRNSHDLYVSDVGVNEVQSVTVSASAGQFRLKFGANTTEDLSFNASEEEVGAALRSLASIGPSSVAVAGGPGDAAGSSPYVVTFQVALGTTDVPQLECENGTTPLSGGSGCSVATTTQGISSTVKRFKADGTPDNFSGLADNILDNLALSGSPKQVQVAVDNSAAGAAKGDIYVTEAGRRLIAIFGEDGLALSPPLSEWSEGSFGQPFGAAVDESGALYVGDFNNPVDPVHKYVPSANPLTKGDNTLNCTTLAGPSSPGTLAVGAGPSAGFIFVDRFNGELFKLNATTCELTELGPITTGVTTVSVDPTSGHLYGAKGAEVVEYDVSGSSVKEVSDTHLASTVQGIAVDGESGNLYLDRAEDPNVEVYAPLPPFPEVISEAADEITPTEATLHGEVNPNGVPLSECAFEWGTTEGYGETAPCESPDAAGVGEGSAFVPVHARISGLSPGTTYHFRLTAANANNQLGEKLEGEDEQLLTLGPSVTAGTASAIGPTTAKISGEVNPRGKATSFEVQYVTQSRFEASGYAEALSAPVPPRPLGSGTEFVPVAQQLSGLAPATSYRFRLVATNEDAINLSPEGTFATLAGLLTGPPDGRAYEMVSPPQKAGGEVLPPQPFPDLGGSCNECLPGTTLKLAMPMQSAPDGNTMAFEGEPFGPNLASGANEYLSRREAGGWGTQSLSSPLFANGRNRGDGYEAFSKDLSRAVVFQTSPALSTQAPSLGEESYPDLYLRDAAGNLSPLVTEAPPDREPFDFRIFYAAANAGTAISGALTHVAFEANDALTPAATNAPAAVDGGPGAFNVYEWAEGELRLVNVAPDGTTTPGAVVGSGHLLATTSVPGAVAVDHAVSDDGSRIFWSNEVGGQLYVRINGEETKEVKDPGLFLAASPDGTDVLLNDGCLYSVEAEECETDLTLDESEINQGGFQGTLGASQDLSRIYFVDTGTLTGPNGEGKEPNEGGPGEDNLYVWDEGTTSFIATLSPRDNEIGDSGNLGDWKPSSSSRTAQVSLDGGFVAFMSAASLTGYDNEQIEGNNCRTGTEAVCQEVFVYDADNAKLRCASCNPSGQRPLGHANLTLLENPVFPPLRQPANLSPQGGGRLFFESQDTLSPSDSNGHIQDVYEWEPAGVASCEEGGPGFHPANGGCVFLVSSGASPNDSIFVDSTPSGNDVFFITREQLARRDKDELLDLYDARVGGGFSEGETAPCEGEACAAPISPPPTRPSAASSSFAGPGNPPPARRKHHRKKKHHRHHKRATGHARGGHR